MTPDLEAALAAVDRALTNNPSRNVFRLPANMSRLLGLLLASARVPTETIRDALTMKSDPKIAIKRLRGYLEPYGVVIKSVRHDGYFLDPDMKDRVKQFITYGVTTNAEGGFEPAPAFVEGIEDNNEQPSDRDGAGSSELGSERSAA